MTFKQDILEDIDTFLEFDEFAEEHIIADKKVECIVDSDYYDFKRNSRIRDLSDDGTYKMGLTIFFRKDTWKTLPTAGETLEIDGIDYVVERTNINSGIVELDVIKYEEV